MYLQSATDASLLPLHILTAYLLVTLNAKTAILNKTLQSANYFFIFLYLCLTFVLWRYLNHLTIVWQNFSDSMVICTVQSLGAEGGGGAGHVGKQGVQSSTICPGSCPVQGYPP